MASVSELMIKAGKVTLLLFIVLVAISGWVEISGRHTPDHWLWGCGLEDDPDESTDEQCWWGSGFDDLLDLTAVILYISVILLLIGYPMRVLTNPERIRRKAEIEFAARNYKGAMALYKKIGDLEKISECASQLEAPQSVAAPTSTPSSDADDTITHVGESKDDSRSRWWKTALVVFIMILAAIMFEDALDSTEYRCTEENYGPPYTIETEYGHQTIQPTREECSYVAVQTSFGLDAEFQLALAIVLSAILTLAKVGGALARRFGGSRSSLESPSTVGATEVEEADGMGEGTTASPSVSDDDDFRKYAVPRGKGVGRVEWKETESGWELVGENTAAEEE